jgi:hypothetical protein
MPTRSLRPPKRIKGKENSGLYPNMVEMVEVGQEVEVEEREEVEEGKKWKWEEGGSGGAGR